jgi:hypothetical protein
VWDRIRFDRGQGEKNLTLMSKRGTPPERRRGGAPPELQMRSVGRRRAASISGADGDLRCRALDALDAENDQLLPMPENRRKGEHNRATPTDRPVAGKDEERQSGGAEIARGRGGCERTRRAEKERGRVLTAQCSAHSRDCAISSRKFSFFPP